MKIQSAIETTINCQQKRRGITLISLVVTIIILLILAGISIALISGSDGILGRATASAEKTQVESAKEQVTLKIGEYQSEFYEGKYVTQEINNASEQGDWIFENYGEQTLKVKDYEFTIQLPEGLEKADNENPYVVTIKKDNRLPTEVKGTLSVDGILEWEENFLADNGSEGENTGLITVTADASYVGTSSCTIHVNAISTVGSIVTYQYKVNDKLLEETGANNCTIQDLEPNSDYTVAITAIDEKGNSKTVSVAVTTKESIL